MTRIKGLATAAGTLVLAASIGFVMQGTDAAQKLYGEKGVDHPALDADNEITNVGSILDVQDITLTSGELETDVTVRDPEPEVIKASTPPVLEAPALPGSEPEEELTLACEMEATARPIAAAMVNVKLSAACLPDERVTIHHNGMIFTETTSATGTLDVTVPALAENAVFIMAFSNGEGAVAQTFVEEIRDFDRVVLQWKGTTGFQIHAREFGAAYGEAGHIWADAPAEPADAITGESGYMMRMGDPAAPEALLAEVYTFPADASDRDGTVALSVEAEVTDINCGLEIEAQTLEIQDGGDMKTQNLTLAVPECEAAGTFLVLNNLIQDLKVAAN